MKVKIKDIAERVGVSITTVSLVLNNRNCRVSTETKERIFRTAEELNYVPNQIARSLATSETKTVGVIIPDITNPFFAEIAKGIGDALNQTGYTMFLSNSYNDSSQELAQIRKFQQHSVDGLIISSANSAQYDLTFERKLSTPLVILDRRISNFKRPRIEVDDFLGGYMATEYFLKCGHRRIACLAADQLYANAKERHNGYCQALKDYGITVDKKLIFNSDFTINGGYEGGLQAIETDATALFASNDLIAIGCYQACREKGVRIPEDISVIGFDDISSAEHLSPRLTTIRQPIYEIGHTAVEMLLSLINDPNRIPPNVVFPLHLIIRESVKNLQSHQKNR